MAKARDWAAKENTKFYKKHSIDQLFAVNE